MQKTPAESSGRGGRTPVPAGHDALAARRRRIALGAMLFPVLFLLVIAIGLVAMHHGRAGMQFFKPAPSGSG